MSWDVKRPSGPKYYYWSVRDPDGRVRKVYVGRGAAAEQQARQDQEARAVRLATQAAARAAREQVAAAVTATHDLAALAALLTRAAMLAAGLRYHRGEWRRARARHGGPDEHDRR
jgi:hypothetical protein